VRLGHQEAQRKLHQRVGSSFVVFLIIFSSLSFYQSVWNNCNISNLRSIHNVGNLH